MQKTPVRWFKDRKLKKFAKDVKGVRILELGCGENSYKNYFKGCHFIATDLVETSKTDEIADVTNLSYESEAFDVVLCLAVLEHCFEFSSAITEIFRVLKKGGRAVFYTPFLYPLHDIPYDYYRFTEFGLRKLLKEFKNVEIESIGLRRMPLGYFVIADK